MRAVINVPARHFSARSQGQGVAAFFSGNSEVGAGTPPFPPMRGEAAFRVTRMGHEMRHFVQESLAQFIGEAEQAGIELYLNPLGTGPPGRGAQSCLPAEAQVDGQHGQAELTRQHPCLTFHHPQNLHGIADIQGGRQKRQTKLSNQRPPYAMPWPPREFGLPRNKPASSAERYAAGIRCRQWCCRDRSPSLLQAPWSSDRS